MDRHGQALAGLHGVARDKASQPAQRLARQSVWYGEAAGALLTSNTVQYSRGRCG